MTNKVEENLVKVRNAGTEQDLGIQYKALKPEVDKLNMMAAKRQQVCTGLSDGEERGREEGWGVRWLPRDGSQVRTLGGFWVGEGERMTVGANRDLIYKQLQQAVSGISNAAQATASDDAAFNHPAGGGELAYALNNFDVSSSSKLVSGNTTPSGLNLTLVD
ncbi:unnamed protein product [Coregonus sp. 'balchen']|nr:unnamed protein product [Coregonus sp. 'balchen']